MKYGVPAGSVYYFESLDKITPEAVVEKYHGKTISDLDEDARTGFGLTLIGGWDHV